MKKKELNELRKKDIKELEKALVAKEKVRIESVSSKFGGKEKNVKKLLNARVDIAQIKTLMTEKRILESIKNK